MKKLISCILLSAMLLSLLASCGFELPQKADLDPDAYPGEANVQNTDYTSQTAWNGSDSDTSWYTNDTSASTFYLSDGADLKGFIDLVYTQKTTDFAGKTVQLSNDINLGNNKWSIPNSNGCFKGTFNGNNCTIGGFKISNVDKNDQSLLGIIGGGATVQNLTVVGTINLNANATRNSIGGVIAKIVGESGKTVTVTNVTSSCTITQTNDTSRIDYLGGIIGKIEGSGASINITGCNFTGKIETENTKYVGGIVGGTAGSTPLTFTDCQNTGLVRGRENIAGILGYTTSYGGNISFDNCDNSGKIQLYYEYTEGCAGGIAARIICTASKTVSFTNCDNTGAVVYEGSSTFKNQTDVNGGRFVGGIAGYVYGKDADNQLASVSFNTCTNTGTIKANRASGGLVGFVQRTEELVISDCSVDAALYFTINDNATTSDPAKLSNRYVGGLLGAVEMATEDSDITIDGCVVTGTMDIHEPYPYFNSKAGGLVGMVRKATLSISNCQINTKFSTKHLEEDDIVNLTIGGFEGKLKSGTSYDWYLPPTEGVGGNTLSTENITYLYHNDIPQVEDYATPTNTEAYFRPIGHQSRYNESTKTYDFRYVFGVNKLNAETDKGIGFQLAAKMLGDSVENKNITVYCPTVYSSVTAGGKSYAADALNCEYICTLVIAGVPEDEVLEVGAAAYAKNTILDITPFTAYKDENEEIVTKEAVIGAMHHTYEPERYTFKREDFSPYLPSAFEGLTGIISSKNINYSNKKGLECQKYSNSSTSVLLQKNCICQSETCSRGWSANGVRALLTGSGPHHYYVDFDNYNKSFNPDLTDLYEAYYSFDFEVTQAGYYDFCFQIRLKGDSSGNDKTTNVRYALVQFDDEGYSEQTELYYDIYVLDGLNRNNGTDHNSYITGYSKYLTAGTHTITIRQPYNGLDGTNKSGMIHIRDIFILKDKAEPVNANIPLPEGAVLYDASFANDVTYALDKTTKTVFDNYRDTLAANGFGQKDYKRTNFQYSAFDVNNTQYKEDGNKIYDYTGNYKVGGNNSYYNDYYIFTNDDYMLNVYFCSATGDMRIVVSDIEEYEKYDAVNDENPAYNTVTTPLFAALDIGGPNFEIQTGNNAGDTIKGATNGLCFVYRLSDGRFMVIDGGYWNDTDTEGEEMARLFTWMQEHADYDNDGNYTNNKVIIAAWLITHHHSDHINGAYKFGMMYLDNENVEIQNFLYNFPSYEYAESNYGTDLAIGGAYLTYFPKMYSMLGHYNSMIVHSGMVYNFADASIEILATHEDFYPNPLNIYNNSSTIFKITLAGKTFLIAGDLQEEGQIKHIKRTGTLLESDFLQVTHHGCNAQLEFYEYIVGADGVKGTPTNLNAIIVWPLPQGESDKWYEDGYRRTIANRWLKKWFRQESDQSNDNFYFASENWVFEDFNS